jgi:hypothetical protein
MADSSIADDVLSSVSSRSDRRIITSNLARFQLLGQVIHRDFLKTRELGELRQRCLVYRRHVNIRTRDGVDNVRGRS